MLTLLEGVHNNGPMNTEMSELSGFARARKPALLDPRTALKTQASGRMEGSGVKLELRRGQGCIEEL